jgi:phage-related protein
MAKDNLGRESNMNPEQLKGVAESLKGRVSDAVPYNKTAGSNKDKDKGSSMSPEMEKNFKDLVSAFKGFMSGKKSGKAAQNEKISVSADRALQIVAKHATKKGSLYTHDVYLEKAAQLQLLETRALRIAMTKGANNQAYGDLETEISKLTEEIADLPKSSPSGVGGKAAAEEERIQAIRENLIPLQLMEKLGNSAGELQETLFGFRGTSVVFKDLVAQERDFTIQTRQAAFEIGGITKESRGLQKSFEDIGKAAAETGFDRTVYQKAYLSNLKKGVKDQKLSENITKKQLNTEKMIGVEAGALGDTFLNMSLQMKMSNNEMSEFGRGIQEVARNTGVTGENLADAVRSSEGIIKNMRNAGNLNAEAASNVVGLMASFKKFGVSEAGEEVASTLSKGMAGFLQADGGMQLLLTRLSRGNMEKIYDGTLLNTKAGMKEAAAGMEDLISQFSGGQVRTREDFEKLSDFQKQELNTKLQLSPLKKSAGELFGMVDSFNEQGASLSEKLNKINKERGKTLTLEEKATLLEQERTLKTNTALEALTKLDAASKGASNMGDALKKLDMSSMADDLKAMGIESTDAKVAMKETMKASIAGVNESLKKAGKTQLSISDKSIEQAMNDPAAFREMTAQINKANAEAGVGEKTQLDVTSELNQSMITLNETLRGTTQGAISSMLSSVFGKSLGILTTLTDIGGQFAGFAFHSVLEYEKLQGSLSMLGDHFGDFLQTGLGQRIVGFGSSISSSLTGLSSSAFAASGSLAMAGVAVAGIAGVIGGFVQSARSGEKAAEIFNKSMEDVTTAEFYAAKGAGFVTGFFNTLTFGIFDYWIGASGTITKALAQFNKMIPILSAVMMVFDAIGGAIYGIGSSIVDILIGPFEMWYYILEPMGEVFTTLGNAISTALGPLFGFSTKLSETGTIFTMFSNIFASVGKVIRGVFRAIGQTIGFLATVVVSVLNPAITLVGNIIGGVANVIGTVFKGVFDAFMGAFKVFEGIATLDFSKIASGFWTMTTSIPRALIGAFQLGFNLIYVQIPRLLLSIPKLIFDAVWDGVSSLAKNDWVGAIFQPFVEILKPLHSAFSDLYRVFEELWTVLGSIFEPFNELFAEFSKLFGFTGEAAGWMGILKTAVQGISSVIGTLLTIVLLPLQLALWGLSNAIKLVIPFVKFFTDLFTVGIVQAFTNLGKNMWNAVVGIFQPIGAFLWSLGESLLAPFKWLYNVLVGNSIVPDLVSEIIMFFATLPIEIMKGLLKLPFMIGGAILGGIESIFGLVPGAIGSALYSAASAVGMGWLFDKIAGTKGGKSVGGGEAANKEAEATGGVAEAVGQTLDPSIKLLSEALTHGAEAIYLSSMAGRLASMPLPLGLISGGVTSGLSSLTGGSTTGSIASTAPSTSIDERVQRDLATTEPSVSSVGGPELGSIAVDGKTQVEKLTEMVGLLTEMVMIMQQSSSGSSGQEEASTLTNYVATSPPKYYKWSTGKHNQTANKGITNISNIG